MICADGSFKSQVTLSEQRVFLVIRQLFLMLVCNPDFAKETVVHDKEDTGGTPGKGITENNGVDIRLSGHGKHNPQDTDKAYAA